MPDRGILLLPCACANLRRAARVVTQYYDQALRDTGMRVTQFTLLQALTRAGCITQGGLGDLLGIDSTTLTRTLRLLRRQGWIEAQRGPDRRQLRLQLTALGQEKFRRALPHWRAAQRRLRHALGGSGWKQIMRASVRAAALTPRPTGR